MPSVSGKQQRFMGAELARARAGQQTDTGMDPSQLVDFTKGPTKGLPEKVKKHHKKPHGAGRSAKPRGGGFPFAG